MLELAIGEETLVFRNDDAMLHDLVPEILGAYDFETIPFRKGDVVIDVGAHRGGVSLYLAKRFGVRVVAYEPEPENFDELQFAIRENKLTRRVRAFNLAVSADGRDLTFRYGAHSGEGGAFHDGAGGNGRVIEVGSVTLASIFKKHRIKRARLLKLDCEGAEHEILAGAGALLKRVDYLRGELHLNAELREAGYTIAGTRERFPEERAVWQECPVT